MGARVKIWNFKLITDSCALSSFVRRGRCSLKRLTVEVI